MSFGFTGRILRVNLSTGAITVDEPGDKFYRTYLGGRGIIVHYLLKEVPPGCEALDPENRLVFAPSVLTGLPIPGSSRVSAGAKSPLTGSYGEGEGGGDWGVKLKWAGYDALVISGKASDPVLLNISEDSVELAGAEGIWGLEVYETITATRERVDDHKASVAAIGPGGERLVRFACIALGTHNYIGRCGLGAVMGAKNLKAIAVNGQQRPQAADRELVKQVAGWLSKNHKLMPMTAMGTSVLVQPLNAAGGLPTRNFQQGSIEAVSGLSGQHMAETITESDWGCWSCPIRCKQVVRVKEPRLSVDNRYSGPEYESIAGFGSNCGITDIQAVAKANEICDRNGIDTISTAMMISGAMACAEKGLVPAGLAGGLNLDFGSVDGMLGLLDRIVKRQGLGDILAEGPKNIHRHFGEAGAACFLHVKGQPLPLHEPRFKTGLGIGYALSPTGADHMHNIHDPMYENEELPPFNTAREMGILDGIPSTELSPEKIRLWMYMMLNRSLNNNLLICNFTPYSLRQMTDLARGATGWNLSDWELLKTAERSLVMARVFNHREGFTSPDDDLPSLFFKASTGGTPERPAIDRNAFLKSRNFAYRMLGWDEATGAPADWKLYELGLAWLVDQRTLNKERV